MLGSMDRQRGPMNRRLGTGHPQGMPLQFQASNQAWHSITDGRGMLLITMIAPSWKACTSRQGAMNCALHI
jgi:hypothetical protein